MVSKDTSFVEPLKQKIFQGVGLISGELQGLNFGKVEQFVGGLADEKTELVFGGMEKNRGLLGT